MNNFGHVREPGSGPGVGQNLYGERKGSVLSVLGQGMPVWLGGVGQGLGGLQVNKFEQAQAVVTWGPSPEQTG